MISSAFGIWFPISIVLSAISVAISIIILEKIQEKFLGLNKKKTEWANISTFLNMFDCTGSCILHQSYYKGVKSV